ncbi:MULTISPECIES: 2-C-methyl-D-erythritol 4-phosphate cytidylyltransferase [Bacillus]|uniref:2-C-methyl-D-erythritol 4-phosphate cytidylyltransferase n=1 Tax=Bacillus TaxID=1386 RepID=UPI000B9B287A|nr:MULTISPECIES: 2-C-methyl-D-erythritol 4-phosphate cytidylyltransferase [Bacillus]MCA1037668.1 2-C-methyl-D-erythritol 4-phosphate cytidylyltransferase [Bacillus infantis]MCK6208506.1 2-C-methyl-D-erythritol 4-phosphate cytidylyltransferase [Bacillus infantis]OXT15559.1 2-C-methyl-D-erythritol 4-phosphate cytidylyltransferase [Bacillus sp. OG2]
MPYQVIIPAAGQGKRMGAGKNKLLLEIRGVPVFIHTLRVFESDPDCTGILLAVNPSEKAEIQELLAFYDIKKVIGLVPGGSERQYSVYNAVKELQGDGIAMVHDAARPFIDQHLIWELTEAADQDGSAVLAVPVKDTVKKAVGNQILETVERSSLWAVQTPQAFRVSTLLHIHQKAAEEDYLGTDDASLAERLGIPVKIVEGNYDNIKLTTPEDLYFAEAIIRKREARSN